MKTFTLAIVGIVSLSSVFASDAFLKESGLVSSTEEFLNYIARFGKSYATKAEFQKRAKLFLKTKMEIMQAASSNSVPTFRLGFNQFSDWTEEEFQAILGNKPSEEEHDVYHEHLKILEDAILPASKDWRDDGVVNPVKDQGRCGSCWAFSTAAGVESHFAIQFGKLYSLSEQQLVDCSTAYDNAGCNGGLATQGYDYVKSYGLEQEADYPYLAADGTCHRDKSKIVAYVDDFHTVQTLSPSQLKAALATQGPASVSVDASGVFKNYQSGILNAGCGTSLNHAILAVGYGVENGQEYYIVRNSWGPSWGENGYIRLAIVEGQGTCGVQIRPSYPITKRA